MMKNKRIVSILLFLLMVMGNYSAIWVEAATVSSTAVDSEIVTETPIPLEEMEIMSLDARRQPGADSGRWPGTNSGDIIRNVDIFNKLNLPAMWTLRTTSNIPIGVIDSGIMGGHEDLSASYMGGATFGNVTTANNIDENGHGTMVAGVIAGYGYNNNGSCGVCWEANIKSLKTVDSLEDNGYHSDESIISAINYADSIGIKILNISLSRFGEASLEMQTAIDNFDGLIVCCAGNNRTNIDTKKVYPACYPSDNVISVGALDENQQPWISSDAGKGSNWGATTVDVFAPGCDVYTTNISTSKYGNGTGTSLAAPMVTALAALIWEAKPNLTAAQVKAAILNNVDVLASLDGKCVTEGRINPYKALMSVYTGTDATRKPFVRIGDINNDSKEDIVVTGSTNKYLRLTTFLGCGDGTYQQAEHTFSVKVFAHSDPIFIGDVNGDGYDDIVLHWVSNGKRQLMLFPGNYEGKFDPNTDHKGFNSAINLKYDLTTNPSQSFLKDVTGDGCADFVCFMKTDSGQHGIWVYKGIENGTGFVTTPVTTVGAYTYIESEREYMDDVNLDGNAELVIHRSVNGMGQLLTYSFDSTGRAYRVTESFTGFIYNQSTMPFKEMLGDVTGDGRADFVLLLCNSEGKSCIVRCDGKTNGGGEGAFQSGIIQLTSSRDYMAGDPAYLEDVSGDGKKDIVVYWIDDIYRQMLVYKSTGPGFAEGVNYSAANRDTSAFPSDHYFTNNHNSVAGHEMLFRWAYSTSRITYFDTFVCGTDGLFYGTCIRTLMKLFPFYVYK